MRAHPVLLTFALSSLAASLAGAQDYPVKPIRIYANQPGGIFDFMARIFAQGRAVPWGRR